MFHAPGDKDADRVHRRRRGLQALTQRQIIAVQATMAIGTPLRGEKFDRTDLPYCRPVRQSAAAILVCRPLKRPARSSGHLNNFYHSAGRPSPGDLHPAAMEATVG